MAHEDLNLDLTPEEQIQIENFLRGGMAGGSSQPEEKHNVHKFLHDVVEAEDTTKLGYLKEEEIGLPKLPLRTLKELALFCKDIAGMTYFGEYFDKQAEIMTSTSLSKDAKLLELSVVQRRELGDITRKKVMKENKGWFKKKGQTTE
jgi:hypothetical protein